MCEIAKPWAKNAADKMYKLLEEDPKPARKGDMWCVGFFVGLHVARMITEKEVKELTDSYP